MAQHRSVDKRRETIRRQLYGKEVMGASPKPHSTHTTSSGQTYTYQTPNQGHAMTGDAAMSNYLTRDLFKILILCAVALSIQFGLYWALNNHLIKMPF